MYEQLYKTGPVSNAKISYEPDLFLFGYNTVTNYYTEDHVNEYRNKKN